jgi:hypothetical protein
VQPCSELACFFRIDINPWKIEEEEGRAVELWKTSQVAAGTAREAEGTVSLISTHRMLLLKRG